MLERVAQRDEAAVLARWRGDAGRKFALRNFMRQDEEDQLARARVYVDDPLHPTLVVATHGARIVIHGARRQARQLMRGLFAAQPGVVPGWPNAEVRRIWRSDERARPYIYLAGSYASFRGEMARAGFVADEEDLQRRRPHYYYWIGGKPRFASHVRHACRLGVGQELHSLLLTGIPYDETGEYTRACLEQGPSVVVEVPGGGRRARNIPVCWSATHLSGAIGMIFTPAAHRGHGYGSSLTAFHTDLLLARDGMAFAQVRWDNYHSQRMFEKLGYRRTREPLTGAAFYWPAGQGPR